MANEIFQYFGAAFVPQGSLHVAFGGWCSSKSIPRSQLFSISASALMAPCFYSGICTPPVTSVESTDLIGKPRIFNNSTLISLLDRGWYFYCHFDTAVYYIIYRVIFYQARAQISFYLVFASSNQIRVKGQTIFCSPIAVAINLLMPRYPPLFHSWCICSRTIWQMPFFASYFIQVITISQCCHCCLRREEGFSKGCFS